MLIRNFKYALNSLRKSKIYSSLNIFGLAISFSVVTIIAIFIISEYSIDRNIPNYENIYRLYNLKQKSNAINFEINSELKNNFPEIENACAVRTFYGFDIPLATEYNTVVEKKVFLTTNSFFDIFDIKPVSKLSSEPLPNSQSAVITKTLANKLFPDGKALGQSINVFGVTDVVVNMVVEDFQDKSLNSNIILFANHPDFSNYGQSDGVVIASHYLVLSENVKLDKLISKFNSFLSEQKTKIESAGLIRLDKIYLNSELTGYNAHDKGNRKMLNIFLTISLLVLLLAIFNNINYTLSLQYNNIKNIGIRIVNGANSYQILGIFFTDSFFKVSISVFISLLITILSLPVLSSLFNKTVDITYLISFKFILFAIALIIFTIIINSSASFYIFSKFKISSFLSKVKSKFSQVYGINVLTVVQLTISIVLLVSIISIKKQISFVKNTQIGFNKEQLLRIGLSESNATVYKDKIEKMSFVKSATLSNGVPGMINYTTRSNVEGNNFKFNAMLVDDDFIKTMGIEIKEGRDFRKGENKDVCIINEAAYKKYGWNNFQGKKYEGWGSLDVVGIATDFSISSLHSLPEPVCLIYGLDRDDYNQISIRLNNGFSSENIKDLENEWLAMNTGVPFNFSFYDKYFDEMYKKEETLGSIISFLSIVAFLITCLGILSVSFQNSLNKSKEIGIRKVNGAKIYEILFLLNKSFVRWVCFSFILAVPIAYFFISKWLENFAYKTSIDWWIFALAGLLSLAITLFTVNWQSWRVANKNPVLTLRYE